MLTADGNGHCSAITVLSNRHQREQGASHWAFSRYLIVKVNDGDILGRSANAAISIRCAIERLQIDLFNIDKIITVGLQKKKDRERERSINDTYVNDKTKSRETIEKIKQYMYTIIDNDWYSIYVHTYYNNNIEKRMRLIIKRVRNFNNKRESVYRAQRNDMYKQEQSDSLWRNKKRKWNKIFSFNFSFHFILIFFLFFYKVSPCALLYMSFR